MYLCSFPALLDKDKHISFGNPGIEELAALGLPLPGPSLPAHR